MNGTGLPETPVLAATASQAGAASLSHAGVDRVVAYHSSVYRQRGMPSVAGLLPWASANEQVSSMIRDVVSGSESTPVVATVCGNDRMTGVDRMLDLLTEEGAVGVLNAPTVGLLEGTVRAVLEAEGLGRSSEMELLRSARERGLEAWAYVFDASWARVAVEAGATALVIHLGITGYGTGDLRQQARRACEIAAEAPSGMPVLLHGGDLTSPERFTALYSELRPLVPGPLPCGFFGASAFEAAADPSAAVRSWRRATAMTTTHTRIASMEMGGCTGDQHR
ncbi:phosphoenolpyruvate hydrolase family protein [Sediminivirga luteola]|uniref:phosphoenolpyruvate hydrolase family protein n=1 Tax=Sediminivirga luteola TaxID=1774748 RepID=UPI00166BF8F6|nr:phosphoenolpyruvate hydrolase family protein [Sediminivirga luteola]